MGIVEWSKWEIEVDVKDSKSEAEKQPEDVSVNSIFQLNYNTSNDIEIKFCSSRVHAHRKCRHEKWTCDTIIAAKDTDEGTSKKRKEKQAAPLSIQFKIVFIR